MREARSVAGAYGGPVGEPGSMPDAWGLPIVPSAREWRARHKQILKRMKRMRIP